MSSGWRHQAAKPRWLPVTATLKEPRRTVSEGERLVRVKGVYSLYVVRVHYSVVLVKSGMQAAAVRLSCLAAARVAPVVPIEL
jgi:hypothetical protein